MIDDNFINARVRELWQIQKRAENAKTTEELRTAVANVTAELVGVLEALKSKR